MTEDSWNRTHLRAMKLRPPLSPTGEDLAFVRAMTAPALAQPRSQVLILGVTPGLVQLDWPEGTEITAVDSSPGMVAAFEPHPSLGSRAVRAAWEDLPLPASTFAAAVGDGSLNAMPSLDCYPPVAAELARVLKPDGVLVLRAFVRPGAMETPDQVVAAAREGAFPTTAAFRFRFALALTGEDGSVGLAAIHEAFEVLVPDRDALARASGWPREDIDRIDVDKDSKLRFTFPALSRYEDLLSGAFTAVRMLRGSYTQAAECPTILFRRK